MFIVGFPAGAFAANCFVVAPSPGGDCIVIDPGLDALDSVEEILAEHRLNPVGVLATHGHADHVWSVREICAARGIPAYIHADDRYLLADPLAGVSGETQAMLRQLVPPDAQFGEPADVREVEDGQRLDVAGLEIEVIGAPGHTPGSVLFRLAGDEDRPPIVFTGDVLFEGSIGRTDLPRGDTEQMMASLANRVLTMDDTTVVLPGHGEATEIGRERATNPFLLQLGASAADGPGASR
ncbi:MAG: MBL fold metallo-hydrolase [Candidatus Nanopelagicales bacterium]|nr:MBL fold metallo-hydrolase [Candidatus Nanopelagicales bacterium]